MGGVGGGCLVEDSFMYGNVMGKVSGWGCCCFFLGGGSLSKERAVLSFGWSLWVQMGYNYKCHSFCDDREQILPQPPYS